ncbi:MAG TPA: hypothetical protein VEA80_07975 [Vitreimonas sp.]|uniref:hypothetical protein n=1 Tax=Vitreimonas sp. TaxID=3069702 RepID=UPI002D41CAD0|nr:hypothetical protein [Vitreimonas sp.]HYD87397.1 hypothetical protein [Vitreimonas sp.]
MSFQNHNERREAAEAAKKAMLEKFKTKAAPAQLDPTEAAKRIAEAQAKEEKRVEAEKRRRERVELERLERKLAAEAAAKAEEERIANEAIARAQRKRAEAEAAELRRFEDEARRDLMNAARKAARK